MERRSSRRKIIDSTSVPYCRRKDRRPSFDNGTSFSHSGKELSEDIPHSISDVKETIKLFNSVGNPLLKVIKNNVNDTETNKENNAETEENDQVNFETDNPTSENNSCFQVGDHSPNDSDKVWDHDPKEHHNTTASCNKHIKQALHRTGDVCWKRDYNEVTMVDELKHRIASMRCLYPTVSEEIGSEAAGTAFMLPWHSIQQNEIYKVNKPPNRQSVVQNAKRYVGGVNDGYYSKANMHEHASDIHDYKRSGEKYINTFSAIDELHIASSFEKTNVHHGLERKDPFSIELEKTNNSVTIHHDETLSSLFADIIEHRSTESPLLDTVSMFDDVFEVDEPESEDGNGVSTNMIHISTLQPMCDRIYSASRLDTDETQSVSSRSNVFDFELK